MQKFLVKKGCQKVDDFERTCMCLTKQINVMSNGVSVIATPLPLKNLKSMFVGSPNAIIVKAYPICSSFYACNNIMVLSCGCTYHQFCVSLHLESKATHCVNPACGKLISNDWIVSSSSIKEA